MENLFQTMVVGSLPRPQYVRDLLGTTADCRWKIENAIRFAINLQEHAGIDVISDGEWRRLSYVGVIGDLLNGFERALENEIWYHTVVEKVSFKQKGLFAEEARFVLENTKSNAKVAIPSPFLVGARMWDKEKSREAYPTREEFMEAVVGHLKQEVHELSKVGVSIVQIDDPNLCFFVDADYRERFEDPGAECSLAVELINELVSEAKGVEVAIHLCRGTGTRNKRLAGKNAKGFVGKGSYEFIMPFLKKLKVDRFVLEFAHPDAGDLSVLEEFPKSSKIGLGCVDVTPGIIDGHEKIVERVESALKYVDRERIVLNPDCGFAPGNQASTTIDEAYLKLRELVRAAEVLRKKYS